MFFFRKTEPLVDLHKPSLEALSFILRHKYFWPQGFVWDYESPSTCALGLSRIIWNLRNTTNGFRNEFSINDDQYERIFFNARKTIKFPGFSFKISVNKISPEMVADEIDDILKSSKVK